jgi:hypothetical protein
MVPAWDRHMRRLFADGQSAAIEPIPNDPLREPRPDEPGVQPDGTASPLENPGVPA